ncbi:MAG: S8 family serine peptidase [Gemmatimonadaceae bacterium]|nr:S8 family serine peptidase [Gemmatimonadaceae bacterium]
MSHRGGSHSSPARLALLGLSLAALAACAPDDPLAPPAVLEPQAVLQGGLRYVPGEVIVRFRGTAAASLRAGATAKVAGEVVETIVTRQMRADGDAQGISIVRTTLPVKTAIAQLMADPSVEYAEPNWIYTTQAISNDPFWTNGTLWGMAGTSTSPANQFGSGAAAAWGAGHTDCSAVFVGIIDEGYMTTHADLAANVGRNPGEIAGDGADNDGNGLVDDVFGWDFDGNNASVFDGLNDDHGTHVAGTIGGVGGNGTGVAGVCWNVKLLSAKFLGNNGGTTANAIKAVDYFTDLKTRHGINLVATSNSWGGGGFSQALQDAIGRANAAGILFIAAAGNSAVNCETSSCYPAEYPNDNVIAVASITSTGALSSFSNYGATTIDIGAPGSAITSTVPGGRRNNITSAYASYSGTSMATPHVSGAAALYKAYHPAATAAQIKAAILGSATPTASLSGRVVTGGRLNASGF